MAEAKKPAVLTAYLKEINKSDKDVVKEQSAEKLVDFVNECNITISAIKAGMPTIKTQITRAKSELAKAKVAQKKAVNDLSAPDFNVYVQRREVAASTVDNQEALIKSLEESLKAEEAQLKGFESILADLTK